jgi:RimJ/RimL family protein N-acetyltransferase
MEIRRVRTGEGARLRKLRLAALADAPHAFSSSYDREAERAAEHWADLARRGAEAPDEVIFVAEGGEEWHGMAAAYSPDEKGPVVWGVWVSPTARGQGVAHDLVNAVLAWSGERGDACVRLWIVEGNEPAERLFRGAGFETTGERGQIDADRVEVFMTRPL